MLKNKLHIRLWRFSEADQSILILTLAKTPTFNDFIPILFQFCLKIFVLFMPNALKILVFLLPQYYDKVCQRFFQKLNAASSKDIKGHFFPIKTIKGTSDLSNSNVNRIFALKKTGGTIRRLDAVLDQNYPSMHTLNLNIRKNILTI